MEDLEIPLVRVRGRPRKRQLTELWFLSPLILPLDHSGHPNLFHRQLLRLVTPIPDVHVDVDGWRPCHGWEIPVRMWLHRGGLPNDILSNSHSARRIFQPTKYWNRTFHSLTFLIHKVQTATKNWGQQAVLRVSWIFKNEKNEVESVLGENDHTSEHHRIVRFHVLEKERNVRKRTMATNASEKIQLIKCQRKRSKSIISWVYDSDKIEG